MDNKLKLIADTFGKEKFKFDELVADHTALKLGGPAKLFFVAVTSRELARIVSEARNLKIPFLIFGTGSKMIVSDHGFNGLVIKNRTKNMAVVGVKGKVSKQGIGVEEALVEVDSGVGVITLAQFLDQQNLSTIDLIGLTGSVGGCLFINANLQKKCKNIKVILQDGDVEEIEGSELSLGKHIILSAIFKFKAKNQI